MKCSVPLLKLFCMAMLCTSLIASCRKSGNGENSGNPPVVNQGDSTNADSISNHLRFFNATKKTGAFPTGPAGSSLKISFKDTLFLSDELKRPIKFLHEDTTKNVAGVYVQVRSAGASSFYYYDVPESEETADSDTVSVILMGVDPAGLIDTDGVPPAGPGSLSFIICLIPYDKNGQPIAEDTRPAIIGRPKVDPDGNGGLCGLVTKPGDYWDWEQSYIAHPSGTLQNVFFNSPDKIWGKNGQDIKGSCCNGNSVYGYCPGESTLNSVLHFNTFFTYTEEIFKFLEDGTFVRLTGQFSANPDPPASDYCGSGEGVVETSLSNVTYYGKWTIKPFGPLNGDSLYLSLQGTSSTGGGYGNPGGRIHILDCNVLMLIQPDNEVAGRDLVKLYIYRNVNSPHWYPFA